jgi:hypothetical protein
MREENYNRKVDDKSFEIGKRKYLGKTQIKISCKRKTKSQLNSENAYYHSVQIILLSPLLYENINII